MLSITCLQEKMYLIFPISSLPFKYYIRVSVLPNQSGYLKENVAQFSVAFTLMCLDYMSGIQSFKMDPTIYRQATFKIQSFGGALEKRIFSLNLTEDETK